MGWEHVVPQFIVRMKNQILRDIHGSAAVPDSGQRRRRPARSCSSMTSSMA